MWPIFYNPHGDGYNLTYMKILRHPTLIFAAALLSGLMVACGGNTTSQAPVPAEPLPTLFEIPTQAPTTIPQPVAPSATPTITPTEVACAESEGQVVKGSYPSQIAEQDVFYNIYLPPCYESSGKSYPVLYELHGLGEGMNYTQWDKLGLTAAADKAIAEGTLSPFIIVMPDGAVFLPDGTVAHGMNYFSPGNSYEFMTLNELMPAIATRYCTWEDASARAIGGLSRGGFWAFEIGLRHPELFTAIGGHSASFYEDAAIPPTNNPMDLARDATGLENLRIYLDYGVSDYPWIQENVAIVSARLNQRGLDHTYIINPVGGHTEEYWAAHVGEYLAFYAENWPVDSANLPDCNPG